MKINVKDLTQDHVGWRVTSVKAPHFDKPQKWESDKYLISSVGNIKDKVQVGIYWHSGEISYSWEDSYELEIEPVHKEYKPKSEVIKAKELRSKHLGYTVELSDGTKIEDLDSVNICKDDEEIKVYLQWGHEIDGDELVTLITPQKKYTVELTESEVLQIRDWFNAHYVSKGQHETFGRKTQEAETKLNDIWADAHRRNLGLA